MGKIVKVSGPLVVATGLKEANMADVVRVGEQRLIGEILTMSGDSASIQVYEETSGLRPGDLAESTGAPISVLLGPGILTNIYDGIERPLEKIAALENVEVTDEDMTAEYEKYAKMYDMDVDKVKAVLGEKDMKRDLAVGKALELVKENAVSAE